MTRRARSEELLNELKINKWLDKVFAETGFTPKAKTHPHLHAEQALEQYRNRKVPANWP